MPQRWFLLILVCYVAHTEEYLTCWRALTSLFSNSWTDGKFWQSFFSNVHKRFFTFLTFFSFLCERLLHLSFFLTCIMHFTCDFRKKMNKDLTDFPDRVQYSFLFVVLMQLSIQATLWWRNRSLIFCRRFVYLRSKVLPTVLMPLITTRWECRTCLPVSYD